VPTAESLLFVAVRVAAVTVAWLATYAAHSTAFLGAAWLATARRDRTTPELRDALWKAALVGSLLTATLAAAGALDPLGGRHDAGRAVEAREWRALPALPAPPAAAPRPADGGASTEAYGARLPSSGGRARAVPLALTLAWLAYAAVVLARSRGRRAARGRRSARARRSATRRCSPRSPTSRRGSGGAAFRA
jgi:hypothetical protein